MCLCIGNSGKLAAQRPTLPSRDKSGHDDTDASSTCSGSTTPDDDALADNLEDAKYGFVMVMGCTSPLESYLEFITTIYTLTHPTTHPLTHSLTHSLTHPTTHSLTTIHKLISVDCVRVRTHTQSYDEVVYEDPQGGPSSLAP